jgi:hypothetical protein
MSESYVRSPSGITKKPFPVRVSTKIEIPTEEVFSIINTGINEIIPPLTELQETIAERLRYNDPLLFAELNKHGSIPTGE